MKRGKPEKYIALAEKLRLRFEQERRRQGDALPPERRLAENFGCSHITVRKALKLLEDANLVYRIPSKGTFMGMPPPERIGKSGIVGYLFPDDELYYYKLFSVIEKSLSEMNLHPVVHLTGGGAARESGILDYLAAAGASAVIAVPNPDCAEKYAGLHIPAVFFDAGIPGMDIPCVRSDDRAGAAAAMEYLRGTGHRRIAFIGAAGDSSSSARLDAYRELRPDASPRLVLLGSPTREWGHYAAKKLFQESARPDALFCGNDTIAAGVIRFCGEEKIDIPGECSIIGYGNTAIAEDLNLTSVSQHSGKIASEIISDLQILLKGGKPPLTTVLPATLVIRGSTASRR